MSALTVERRLKSILGPRLHKRICIKSRLDRSVSGLVRTLVGSHSVELASDLLEGFRHTG